MDEVSGVPPIGDGASGGSNLSEVAAEWWAGALEEDAASLVSPIPLDAGDGGLWAGNFVPPPPRPTFLDDAITSDGLTTCDLCSWAWKDTAGLFSLDGTLEAPGELSWLLTLVIVSLISAVIGAVIMVTVLHWRRFKSSGSRGMCSLCAGSPPPIGPQPIANETNLTLRLRERAPVPTPNSENSDKEVNNSATNTEPSRTNATGVWSWLTSRKSTPGPIQLIAPTNIIPAENHYTHMDETYAAVGEALYAELDRESNCSPAYQNTAYTGSDTEPEAAVSSAPSSAYYSDLSVTAIPDRAYEVVGMGSIPGMVWEGDQTISNEPQNRRAPPITVPVTRLAAINETITVQPSDYV